MPRVKDTISRRDNKGRILPKGVTQRTDGRFMFRMMRNGKMSTPIYDWDLTRLKKRAEEFRSQVDAGVCSIDSCMTLNQWISYYMEYRKATGLSEISVQRQEEYYKWYVRDTSIGKKSLRNLTRLQLLQHYRQLQEREEHPLSIGTVRRVNSIIEQALDGAVVQGVIPVNVAHGLGKEIPEIVKQKKREALPAEEVERLLKYIKNHNFFHAYYNMFVIMLGLGLRVGEMCALTDQDVMDDHILIYKSLNYRNVDGKRVKFISDTKTISGIRSLPYPDEVRKAILAQRENNRKNLYKCKETLPVMFVKSDKVELDKEYSNFFFYGNEGTAYTPDYIDIIIKRIRKAFDRDEKKLAEEEKREMKPMMAFSSHYLRHTFATRASEAGLKEEEISRWLGHSLKGVNSATKVYVHKVWKDEHKKLRSDLEKLNQVRIMVS